MSGGRRVRKMKVDLDSLGIDQVLTIEEDVDRVTYKKKMEYLLWMPIFVVLARMSGPVATIQGVVRLSIIARVPARRP
ncbi:hypothetical protein ACI3LZ_001097 [Candidozyma auris]|nr:hypothetical protein QG37_02318 [[Candida] auris]